MKVLRMILGWVGVASVAFGVTLIFSVVINFAEAPRGASWISMGNALLDAWRVYWRFAIPIIIIIVGAVISFTMLDN